MTALLVTAYGAVALLLFAMALLNLWWMLDAWRTPQALAATGFDDETLSPQGPALSFSLIVPARHEEAVLARTLDSLAGQRHPDFEVVVVVGHDDPGTRAVADAAAARHRGLVRVVVDDSWPKNKPKALNAALPSCRGDVVGVFDAEDTVAPGLLARVEQRFARSGAQVVQGGVQLMDVSSSWYAVRNVLEYFFWFRSRLHFQSRQRFVPLGGNTVFVERALLLAVGGWDNNCLAEDCELGVRLSVLGARVAVAYEPALATREETPPSLGQLLKQRTRWNQGFLQVLRKGAWRELPRGRQRLLAVYVLAMPFLQAISGLLLPAALLTAVAGSAPVWLVLLSYLPLVPLLTTLAVEVVGLGEFGRNFGIEIRLRDRARLILGTPIYQAVLALAAVRAVARELRGSRDWEKTAHVGAHRVPALHVAEIAAEVAP